MGSMLADFVNIEAMQVWNILGAGDSPDVISSV